MYTPSTKADFGDHDLNISFEKTVELIGKELAEQPFIAPEFAYAFLEAFGNKKTTIKRLRSGSSNKSTAISTPK
ncbi:MAG TPA: hypothetical protein EYP90_08895 [Chromatiaceae bacterium]|nr:hypothetical protein [Chromatiaceae bacterium]